MNYPKWIGAYNYIPLYIIEEKRTSRRRAFFVKNCKKCPSGWEGKEKNCQEREIML
jgi:hypothetical protein